MAQLAAQARASRVSKPELTRATAQLRNIVRKHRSVLSLVDGEIHGTEMEFAWLSGQMEAANKTRRLRLEMQVDRAAVRLDALRAAK